MRWWLLALALFLIPTVYAIGISPTSLQLSLEEGANKSLTFYAINSEDVPRQVEIYVHGELAKYARLSTTHISLAPKEIRPFKVHLKLPQDLEAGNYKIYIGVRTVGGAPAGTGMSSFLAAESILSFKSFLKLERIGLSLFVQNVSSVEQPVQFKVAIERQPKNLTADLKVFDPTGQNLASFPLEFKNKSAVVNWSAQEIGRYHGLVEANWPDGIEEKDSWFSVGQPYIEIVNISVLKGGILEISAKSKWNNLLDVWAEGALYENGSLIEKARSEHIPFSSHGQKHIQLYFERQNLSKYDIEVILHYAGLKTVKRLHAASSPEKEGKPKIKNPLTGALAALKPIEPIHILIAVLFVILLVLIYIYFKEPKKPKQRYQRYYYPYQYQNYYYDPYWYWRR